MLLTLFDVLGGQVPLAQVPPVPGQGLGAPLPNLQPPLVAPTPLSAAVPEDIIQAPIEELPIESPLEDDYSINQDAVSDNQESHDSVLASSNEPKTYATLLKSGGGNMGYPIPQSNNVYAPPPKSLSPPVSSF